MNREYASDHSLHQAQTIGFFTTSIGHLLIVFGATTWLVISGDWHPEYRTSVLFLPLACFEALAVSIPVFTFVTLPTGLICAWISHRMFDRTDWSVCLATLAISAIAVITAAGWVFYGVLILSYELSSF